MDRSIIENMDRSIIECMDRSEDVEARVVADIGILQEWS